MKKGIIILLEIGVLLVVLNSSFVQFLLADTQQKVSGWITYLSETEERQQLEGIRNIVLKGPFRLKTYQISYLQDITGDKRRLHRFHRLYCLTEDKNPYLYGPAKMALCREIDQHPSLLQIR